MIDEDIDMTKNINIKPIIMQHYSVGQINNGGPATGAKLLINSKLKEKYKFVPLEQTFAPHGLNIKLIIDFYKKIKKVKPDILHIRGLQSEGFYGVIAGKIAGCKKIVVSVHGLYSDSRSVTGLKKWIFYRILEPATLKLADLVYCVCEYASNRPIIKNNSANLYGYIWNAAPNYSFYDKVSIKKNIRAMYKLNDNDIIFTTVSRITEDKGIPTLVQAILKLENKKRIKFIIVGDGPYLSSLIRDLKAEIDSNSVIITGKSDQVNSLLLASDVFIFPSLHENLSNALLEASSASLPCIATNVGGNTEVVINNKTGLIIDPNNPDQLLNAINILAESPELRNKLGTAAYVRIQENFSQDIIFNKIEIMYDTLINK